MNEIMNSPAEVLALALEALSLAVQSSFTAMTGEEAEICLSGDCGPKDEDDEVMGPVMVAGLIGLMGNWKGTGILECTPDLACELSNLILGIEDSALKVEGIEAVAEMSNIIFGTMKTKLEETLGYMGMSTPTVICGTNLGLYNAGTGLTTLPCRFGKHEFVVKVAIARAEQKRRPLIEL